MPSTRKSGESSPPVVVALGHSLREAQTKAGLSVRDLASSAGVSTSYISSIVGSTAKRIRPEKLAQLEVALGLEEGELHAEAIEQIFKEMLQDLDIAQPGLLFRFEDLDISVNDLAAFLERSPRSAKALLHAIYLAATTHELTQDRFLDTWVRSRVLVNDDYWNVLEAHAASLIDAAGASSLNAGERIEKLAQHVRLNLHYAPLRGDEPVRKQLDSLYAFQHNARQLYLNEALRHSNKDSDQEGHRLFLIAREVAHQWLNSRHHKRHNVKTLRIWPRIKPPLAERIADYDAEYVAVAILLPRKAFKEKVTSVFELTDHGEALGVFKELLDEPPHLPRWLVMNRLVPILQLDFKLKPSFLVMDRYEEHGHPVYRIGPHMLPPRGHITSLNPRDHHCRLWQTTKLLKPHYQPTGGITLVGNDYLRFQRTTFFDRTTPALDISLLLQKDPLRVITASIPYTSTPPMNAIIRFAKDPTLPNGLVGLSCETCGIADSCEDKDEHIHRRRSVLEEKTADSLKGFADSLAAQYVTSEK